MARDEIKIRELTTVSSIKATDFIIVEVEDGTKKATLGTLQQLIARTQYFNNVNEMINTDTLKVGDICVTHGYYEAGDGGGATYKITTINDTNIVDNKANFDIFTTDDSGLVAELILDNYITIEQFGAKGDGVTDDILSFNSAINICKGKIVNCNSSSKYYITDSIIIDGTVGFKFNNCTFIPIYTTAIKFNSMVNCINIDQFSVDGTNGNAIEINGDCLGSSIDQITVKETEGKPKAISFSNFNITFNNADNILFKKIILDASITGNLSGIVVNNNSSDTNNITIESLLTYNINNVITTSPDTTNINLNISNITSKSTLNNSLFLLLYGSPIITINNIFIQGYNNIFNCYGSGTYDILISNFTCYNDTTCKILDSISTNGIVSFNGKLRFYNTNILKDSMIWVSRNYGTIYINTIDIKSTGNFLESYVLENNSSSYSGKIISQTIDYTNEEKIVDSTDGVYNNTFITNKVIDWATSINLSSIKNVHEGQVLYIKSSTGMSISTLDNSNIILKSSIIKNLSPYNGVTLRINQNKAIEV